MAANEDEELVHETQLTPFTGSVDRMMFHKTMERGEAKVGRRQSSCFNRPVFIILSSSFCAPIILSCPASAMDTRTDLAEIGGIGYWIAARWSRFFDCFAPRS